MARGKLCFEVSINYTNLNSEIGLSVNVVSLTVSHNSKTFKFV